MRNHLDLQLLNTLPDSLLLVRRDGAIYFANRQAEELFGYSADELSRLEIEMLLPERYRERHR
jgi:PAS domain S-box-containing protein